MFPINYDIPIVRWFSCRLEHSLGPGAYEIQEISKEEFEATAKDEGADSGFG